jgi:hypothetical protein
VVVEVLKRHSEDLCALHRLQRFERRLLIVEDETDALEVSAQKGVAIQHLIALEVR